MQIRSIAVTFSAAAILAGLLTVSVQSHDEPGLRAHHIDVPANPTAVMKAFSTGKLGDQMGVQNLSAASATTCSGGMAGIYPCENVDLMAFLPLADIGQTQSNDEANDIWGWTDPVTGKEYAIIGRVFGTSFIDITDPTNPVYVAELDIHGRFGSSWRDVKVYNDHAFVVSEARRYGMQVFDLTQLRDVTNPPALFQQTARYSGFGSAHNIVINEDTGYAYGVGTDKCNGGLAMVDIQDPTNPVNAGCYSGDGYTHDAQCVIYTGPDPDHGGSEICFASNEDTLTIVDVTDKANPVQLSRTVYFGSSYTHQGWLTEDQVYFLLDDELDEQDFSHPTRTRVFNIADLDNPAIAYSYDSSASAIDHNQYVKGNYSYQANYRAGLRILDISDIANITEDGYFDIYPDDDAAQFNAAWSNYPYFDSGIVIVSGIEQGLFVLRPNPNGVVNDAPSVNALLPDGSANVSGASVAVSAAATDNDGVTQVEFFIDGSSIGVDVTSPYAIIWDSTSVADGVYYLKATATDATGLQRSTSHRITVDNGGVGPTNTLHVGDIDGSSEPGGRGGKWNATAATTVHDEADNPIDGATVTGTWSNGASGSGSCVTSGGQCVITKNNIKGNSASATFSVTSVSATGYVYSDAENHDPDGDSDGTTIVIASP